MRTLFYPRGVTMVETLLAISIGTFILLLAATVFVSTSQTERALSKQVEVQKDARRALADIIAVVRKAETSNAGAYPIVTAATNTLTLFANVDNDTSRERVRYFVSSTALYKGVAQPTGSPATYATSSEQITKIAAAVYNMRSGVDLFSYVDASYTGTQPPLAQPVSTTAVRGVRVRMTLDEDPSSTPTALTVESFIAIRNLKE
jgi:type II secretory pathway pseudopilin PulG